MFDIQDVEMGGMGGIIDGEIENPMIDDAVVDDTGNENNNNDHDAQLQDTSAQPRRQRTIKTFQPDKTIGLRNTDLARWNNGYVQNMVHASEQKWQNKVHTQARKNAAFWVFGQGIGSVGIGMGASQAQHPLQCYYSGNDLWTTLCGDSHKQGQGRGQKRRRDLDEVGEIDSKERRRRLGENDVDEVHIGRGGDAYGDGDMQWNDNVEDIMQDVCIPIYIKYRANMILTLSRKTPKLVVQASHQSMTMMIIHPKCLGT